MNVTNTGTFRKMTEEEFFAMGLFYSKYLKIIDEKGNELPTTTILSVAYLGSDGQTYTAMGYYLSFFGGLVKLTPRTRLIQDDSIHGFPEGEDLEVCASIPFDTIIGIMGVSDNGLAHIWHPVMGIAPVVFQYLEEQGIQFAQNISLPEGDEDESDKHSS